MNAVSEALKHAEPTTSIKVDGKRLWDSLMTMAKIGATPKGGVCRLALTDLDKQGRDLIVSWAKEAGCTVSVDQMGNVFMRRAGRNPDALPVMTGSHADSQPTGGRFDGIYGVLGGLEVIRSLNDHGIETEHPVEVVIWTNEEGSRFAPAMVASGVFAGVFTLDYGLSRKDVDGKTIGEELKRIGYAGDLPCGGRPLHAAFELHIEQGPILEAEQKTIGVVTDAQGQRWYEITLTGQEAHAGPTPMPRRRDALLGAARVVELVNRIGLDNAPFGCATVGMMQVYPNSRNVIPGRVFFTVDFRHPDDAVLAKMDAALRQGVADITKRHRAGNRTRTDLLLRAGRFRRSLREVRTRRSRTFWLFASQHGVRCGTRRLLSVASRADFDGVRAVRRRDQSQRDRGRHLRMDRSGR